MKGNNRLIPYLFLLPAFLSLFLFRISPIIFAAIRSFQRETLMGETTFVGLANYITVLNNPAFWDSLKVTLVFNLIINPLQTATALGLALLVFRPTKGVAFFRVAYFLPMTVSIALTSVLWNVLLDPHTGLVNEILRFLGFAAQPFFRDPNQAVWSIIWIATWKGIGYWMIFMLAGLYDIPSIYYEAAQIDGASWLRMFTHVTIPLMKRTIAFVLVADTAINFLLFAPSYIITRGGPNNATNFLMYMAYDRAFVRLSMGQSAAISMILLFIIVIIAIMQLHFFRSEVEY